MFIVFFSQGKPAKQMHPVSVGVLVFTIHNGRNQACIILSQKSGPRGRKWAILETCSVKNY